MTEYTPDTEAVRKGYSYVSQLPKGERHHPPLMAEFDRWLNEIRAEAWDEGFDAGEADVYMHDTTPEGYDVDCIENPYRLGEK